MTDKDIKLELAKAALKGGRSVNQAADFYRWITGDGKEGRDLSSIDVSTIIPYLDKVGISFINRCKENKIYTIQDLVNIGSGGFKELKHIGPTTYKHVADALREQFGVENW